MEDKTNRNKSTKTMISQPNEHDLVLATTTQPKHTVHIKTGNNLPILIGKIQPFRFENNTAHTYNKYKTQFSGKLPKNMLKDEQGNKWKKIDKDQDNSMVWEAIAEGSWYLCKLNKNTEEPPQLESYVLIDGQSFRVVETDFVNRARRGLVSLL
jgi:hypothetical protein